MQHRKWRVAVRKLRKVALSYLFVKFRLVPRSSLEPPLPRLSLFRAVRLAATVVATVRLAARRDGHRDACTAREARQRN